MKLVTETIGPERASELLAMNSGNFRQLSRRRVAQYAQDMTDGNWEVNGETIKISSESIILDGQHRLHAIVKSGATIETAVVYDITCDGTHIDRGATRKASDWLRHEGFLNCTNLAATARLVLCHESKSWNWNQPSCATLPLDAVIARCRRGNEGLQQAINLAGKVSKSGVRLPQSMVAAVLFLGANDNLPEESPTVQWFANRLASGVGLSKSDAVYHLREKTLLSASSESRRISREYLRALTCLAWNKTVLGEPTKILKLAATGPSMVNIPYVIQEGSQ